MSQLASTERDDCGKAQSGRRKAILADGRLRVRIVRERETNPFNRVGIPGANRRQDAFGRRRESHDSWIPKHCNKCLWYQERYAGYATRAVDYIDALRNRTLMLAALEQSFETYDAIVAPTLPTVAYPVDRPFDEAYPKYPGALSLIPAGNLIGAPAIGLPNGFAENGLPTGLSLLGLPWCEVKLTRIAREYQRRSDFHRARPKL